MARNITVIPAKSRNELQGKSRTERNLKWLHTAEYPRIRKISFIVLMRRWIITPVYIQ